MTPTAAAEPVSAPTATLVSRSTTQFFQDFVDGGLVAVIGLSPAQLPAFCTGDGSVLDEVSIQQVTRPDSSAKVTIRGSVRVIVYSIGGASELCDLTAVSPLATGTAQLTVTDNDLFVSLNRTNSFGLKLTGIASGDGGRFKVQALSRATIKRNGEIAIRNLRFRVKPIGR
jgi:hypothetical protein